MGPAAAALACAINLLGVSGRDLPPVELVERAPVEASPNVEGFVRPGTPVIYLVASAPPFRDADCSRDQTLFKLASVVMHETWHVRHGPDERGAYEAQLMTLLRLGAKTDSPVYRGVLMSMRHVLKARDAARDSTPASAAADCGDPPCRAAAALSASSTTGAWR